MASPCHQDLPAVQDTIGIEKTKGTRSGRPTSFQPSRELPCGPLDVEACVQAKDVVEHVISHPPSGSLAKNGHESCSGSHQERQGFEALWAV